MSEQRKDDPHDQIVKVEDKDVSEGLRRLRMAVPAVVEDAKRKGLKKGNGGTGEVDCPVCQTGRLCYSVASMNGHIWGTCTTPGCVRWMQ